MIYSPVSPELCYVVREGYNRGQGVDGREQEDVAELQPQLHEVVVQRL